MLTLLAHLRGVLALTNPGVSCAVQEGFGPPHHEGWSHSARLFQNTVQVLCWCGIAYTLFRRKFFFVL